MTPAQAGTTFGPVLRSSLLRDDPRAGGDDVIFAYVIVLFVRMTPARAGTTQRRIRGLARAKDDPRAGGDDLAGVLGG